MGISGGPDIIRDSSLVLELDAADRNSYVSGSTTWRNLSGNSNTGTLTNGPTFSSANGGNIVFDGSDDFTSLSGTINLGNTFTENINIKSLLPFEGDSIFEGRTGNSLRFTSTTKYNNKENFWSLTGTNGDPITLLTNGHNFDSGSLKPYVENINTDNSSLYLTSTQKVPIKTREFTTNLLFNPIKPDSYFNSSQVILSGNRIILNAKTDSVLISGQNSVGISSNNSVNIESTNEIDIASKLGLQKNSIYAMIKLAKKRNN
jgi:hypothetical protein